MLSDEAKEVLLTKPWLPANNTPPHIDLPLKKGGPLVSASSARPMSDAWMSSSSNQLVGASIHEELPDPILDLFGWNQPLDVMTLARQILSIRAALGILTTASCRSESFIGQLYEDDHLDFSAELDMRMPTLYKSMSALIQSHGSSVADVKSMLEPTEWLWMRGKFVSIESFALLPDLAMDTAPFLFHGTHLLGLSPIAVLETSGEMNDNPLCTAGQLQVFKELSKDVEALLNYMGAKERFTHQDYVNTSHRIAALCNRQHRSLASHEMSLITGIAQKLASDGFVATSDDTELLLPSQLMDLRPVSSLVYNDASWMNDLQDSDLNILHPEVSIVLATSPNHYADPAIQIDTAIAEKLGVRSLQMLVNANSDFAKEIKCPALASLQIVLSRAAKELDHLSDQGNEATTHAGSTSVPSVPKFLSALSDILDSADGLECQRLDFTLDHTEYEKRGLLHPNLGRLQGPALVLCTEKRIDPSRLSTLLDPFAVLKSRSGTHFPFMRDGLGSSFVFSDCVSVLSGQTITFFDPSAKYLSFEQIEEHSQQQPMAKSFDFLR